MKSLICIAVLFFLGAGPAWAGPKSALAKEAAEFLFKKGTKEVIEHGVEAFARKIETMALRHGDDVFHAVKAVGPRALPLIEKEGAKAAKVMATHGEKGMIWVVERPGAMKLYAKHGEKAAEVMVKHAGIAEPLIEKSGTAAISALSAVGPRSARRIAIMAEEEATKFATNPKVLDVIAKYGEKGADFIWKHKVALGTAAVLTAFLADPEPFINGTKDITKIVGETTVKPMMESVVKPLAEMPVKLMEGATEKLLPEVGKKANWTLIILAAGGSFLAVMGMAFYRIFPSHIPFVTSRGLVKSA